MEMQLLRYDHILIENGVNRANKRYIFLSA